MATSTPSARPPSRTSSGTTSEPDQPIQWPGAPPDRDRHARRAAGPPGADRGPVPPTRRAVAALRVARARDGVGRVAGGDAGGDRSCRRAPAAVADRGLRPRRGRPATLRPRRGAGRDRASADGTSVSRARPGADRAGARRRWADRAVCGAGRRVEPRRVSVGLRAAARGRIAGRAPETPQPRREEVPGRSLDRSDSRVTGHGVSELR